MTQFDEQLGEFLANMWMMRLMITADHGCDPGYTGTESYEGICALPCYMEKRSKRECKPAIPERVCIYGGDDAEALGKYLPGRWGVILGYGKKLTYSLKDDVSIVIEKEVLPIDGQSQ